MPVMNGFDAARLIKSEFPATLIVIVSQFDSATFEREAIAAGASGYVAKNNASNELIPVLRRTVSGKFVIGRLFSESFNVTRPARYALLCITQTSHVEAQTSWWQSSATHSSQDGLAGMVSAGSMHGDKDSRSPTRRVRIFGQYNSHIR